VSNGGGQSGEARDGAAEGDRAAVRALVDALPRCCNVPEHGCETANGKRPNVATTYGTFGGTFCDESPTEGVADLPYAAPLRALLARMATWPSPLVCRLADHVAPDAPPSPLAAARTEANRLRALAEEAQDDYMRAECHARALESGAGEASALAQPVESSPLEAAWADVDRLTAIAEAKLAAVSKAEDEWKAADLAASHAWLTAGAIGPHPTKAAR
jgi:hypothetical protein